MDVSKATLAKQSYGIAMAQVSFGGPKGIWLECSNCPTSQKIVGTRFEDDPYANITDAEAASVFRRHGWTGKGDRMLGAKCPACAEAAN